MPPRMRTPAAEPRHSVIGGAARYGVHQIFACRAAAAGCLPSAASHAFNVASSLSRIARARKTPPLNKTCVGRGAGRRLSELLAQESRQVPRHGSVGGVGQTEFL